MITGFNTNVRHGGRVFHVQTEDSGRDHPHVISHLYCGGTIVATQKREYAELLEAAGDDLDGRVRQLMEEQHRGMLAQLRDGGFDAAIGERLGGSPPAAAEPAGGEGEPASAELPTAPGADSGRPLDELILDYLVQKARERRRPAPPRE